MLCNALNFFVQKLGPINTQTSGLLVALAQKFYFVHCNHFGKLEQTEPAEYLPAEIREAARRS